MSIEETSKVPPNGKWGWIIVVAYALNGISTIPIMQGFGLIFKDTFPLYGFTGTEGAIIINTNLAFGMILGLINGPLLQNFGYRKLAVFGSILYCIGVTMTAFTKSFPLFIIFYGIFASLGTCMTFSAFSYALNSYFTTKRGRAMSLALTMIGLGPILVPQITTFLISYYGFQGTILLYGAFSLHSLVGSTLLHPLKWHTKNLKVQSKSVNEEIFMNKNENETTETKSELDEKNTSFQEEECLINSVLDLSNTQRKRKSTSSKIDHDSELGSIYGFDVLFARQLSETLNVSSEEKDVNMYKMDEYGQLLKEYGKSQQLCDRFKSVDTINLGSSVNIFEEKPNCVIKHNNINTSDINDRDFPNTIDNLLLGKNKEKMVVNAEIDCNEKCEKKSAIVQIFQTINQFFDLDLLRDPIYVNIMLGMSIAVFAEANFSQLTPFILTDMNLSTENIGRIMSIIATVDLFFRMLAPFLGEWLRQPPRIMYLLSLCLLIIGRSLLMFVNEFTSMIFIAVGLGAFKGIRAVYMSLVIPHYVPIDRLPNASGIQMIVNGIILLTAGPILGLIRDNTGYYASCLIMINSLTALTVIMWSVEIVIVWRRKLRMEKQQDNF